MKAVELDLDLWGYYSPPSFASQPKRQQPPIQRASDPRWTKPSSQPSQSASQQARGKPGSRAQQGIQSPRDLYNSRAKPSYPSRPSSPPPPTPRAIPRVELQITNVGLSRVILSSPLLSSLFLFRRNLPPRCQAKPNKDSRWVCSLLQHPMRKPWNETINPYKLAAVTAIWLRLN